jgi:hypothetical protein
MLVVPMLVVLAKLLARQGRDEQVRCGAALFAARHRARIMTTLRG